MPRTQVEIRPCRESDVPAHMDLMLQLAAFEGHDTKIADAYLKEHGFGPTPTCDALVAQPEDQSALAGMTGTHVIPFAFHARPILVLKEHVLSPEARGQGIGSMLFNTVKQEVRTLNCSAILWRVVLWIDAARACSSKHGGQTDERWKKRFCDDLSRRHLTARAPCA